MICTDTVQSEIPLYVGRRQFPKFDDWVPKLEAWVPTYLTDYGNAVTVYLLDGTRFHLGIHTNRLHSLIANYYLVNVQSMRKEYIECTNRSQSIPLPVGSQRLVYFAVKARSHGLGKNDGSFGWVANTRVDSIEPMGDRECALILKSGSLLSGLEMSALHCKEQRRLAEIFVLHLLRDGKLADGGWRRV